MKTNFLVKNFIDLKDNEDIDYLIVNSWFGSIKDGLDVNRLC